MMHIIILFSAKLLSYPESKMNSLINNAGYSHVTKKIFMLLDGQNLLACRLTCQSWKINVEQPDYLIEKCKKKGQPKELEESWIDLLQKIKKDTRIEKKVVQCLLKWSIQCHLWSHLPLDGFTPAHIAAQYGCLGVVQFIWTKAEILNSLWMPHERLPIHVASANGHTEVVKFLGSKIDNLNILDHYGNAPIHYAASNGQLEIVEFIATKVENPNYVTHYGICPFMLAYRKNHYNVTKFLFPYTTKDVTYLLKIPANFALKYAWRESKETKDFLQSSIFCTLLKFLVLNLLNLLFIYLCISNSYIENPLKFPAKYSIKSRENYIEIQYCGLSSNISHVSEEYDYFHSLNVTHGSLSEITDDNKTIFPNCANIVMDLFCLFISLCTKKFRKLLLPYCHSHLNHRPSFSSKYVLLMYLSLRDPLPDPSLFSWSMVFIQVEYITLLFDIIMDTCPKHYMQPHTAETVPFPPLQIVVLLAYFSISCYYFSYFLLYFAFSQVAGMLIWIFQIILFSSRLSVEATLVPSFIFFLHSFFLLPLLLFVRFFLTFGI